MPRQFFVATVLNVGRDRGAGNDEGYLLLLARQLPRDDRIAAISGKLALADDPDLQAAAGDWFLLDHAADLFRQEDADLMLRLEAQSAGSSKFAVAAAMLRPAKADDILIAALERVTDRNQRTEIATALARLGNERGIAGAVKWFYQDPPAPGGGFGREAFLRNLHDQDAVRFRKVVEQIIRDERLETLGPASTRGLIQAASGYLGRTLADEEDIRKSYGFEETQRNGKFGPLGQWHKALRATVDEWTK
jgi:hypothetical protein